MYIYVVSLIWNIESWCHVCVCVRKWCSRFSEPGTDDLMILFQDTPLLLHYRQRVAELWHHMTPISIQPKLRPPTQHHATFIQICDTTSHDATFSRNCDTTLCTATSSLKCDITWCSSWWARIMIQHHIIILSQTCDTTSNDTTFSQNCDATSHNTQELWYHITQHSTRTVLPHQITQHAARIVTSHYAAQLSDRIVMQHGRHSRYSLMCGATSMMIQPDVRLHIQDSAWCGVPHLRLSDVRCHIIRFSLV